MLRLTLRWTFLAVVGLPALIVSSPCLAAPSQETVRDTAEAVLVEVPVRVVDRDGQPIRGLTATDFELFDDGKRQEILGFDAIDLAQKGLEAPESPALHPAARRHFLLLFDLSFARPRAVLAARKAAKEFVLRGMGDKDFAAVATFSVEAGVRLLVTFSNDRVQLSSAIETLGLSVTEDLSKDPLAFAFDISRAAAMGRGEGMGGKETQSAAITETLQTMASISRARVDQYARGRIVRLTSSLGALAQALDAVQGRKDVIYLSEGFESRLIVGTKDTDQERDWIISGEQWKVDQEKRFGNSHLQGQIRSMSELFQRSDCVIHAVDIAGLVTDSDAGGELVPNRSENALFELAAGTGGEVFRNDNDLMGQLRRLIARTSLVYVLAFRPQRSSDASNFHSLKVKVRKPGVRVSARAGYYEKKAFRGLSALERSLLAADVIANEISVSDIPARVVAAPLPGPGGIATVPVVVEVPGSRLIAGQQGDRAQAEIYVYAYDSERRLRDFSAQTVRVDLATNREKLEKGGLRYYGRLALPAGDYRLRVLVRNAETGRMGLAVENLHVPDFSDQRAYLAPPLFLESSAAGIVVNGGAGEQGASGGRADLVLESDGVRLLPTALPEIEVGGKSRLSLVAYRFGEPLREDSLKVGAQVLSSDGRPLGVGAITILGQSSADDEGKRVLLVGFTPEGLTPGRYALRVFLQDAATGQAGHGSAPFLVR